MKDVTDTDFSKWTRDDFLFHHRKMWNWIADQTLRLKKKVLKQEYFIAMRIPKNKMPCSLCYCCQYNIIRYDGLHVCKCCPVN